MLQLTEKYPVMEKSIRQAIREELAGVSISGSGESVSKKEEIPSQMLDFLSGLEDAFWTSQVFPGDKIAKIQAVKLV